MITLRVPALIAYRDLVTRAVRTACKIATGDVGTSHELGELSNAMVSAVGEAFNNVVEHSYAHSDGDISILISQQDGILKIVIEDYGAGFVLEDVPTPDLDALPESGMGVYIMHAFVDELQYTPGSSNRPNVLTMSKRL